MKKLILLILFLLPISISSFIKNETAFFIKPIIVHIIDKDLYLEMEDYIIGVVSGEMPASFEVEALKAQAIASRSFAYSKMKNNIIEINSSTNDQVYLTNYELKDKWNEDYNYYFNKIKSVVDDTKNMVVKRNGEVLMTYYFSMSNGYTENSKDVFNVDLFDSVKSDYESKLANFEVEKTISETEMLNKLNLNNIEIKDIKKSDTNHVSLINISGNEYTGIEIRKLLGLRSTDFEVEKNGNNYIFTTRGYGHGVGMSQYGANEMAKENYNYKDIINYYYKNTNIDSII